MTIQSTSEALDLAQFSVCQVLNIGDGRPDYGNMLACLRELRELFRGTNQAGHDTVARLLDTRTLAGAKGGAE